MQRKFLLQLIKVAGYHEDTQTGLRLYTENRISWEVYNKYFNLGRKAKLSGAKCSCFECNPKN